MTTIKNARYIVHGIACDGSGKKTNEYQTKEEAERSMEEWMGWWQYYKDLSDLGGTEADFHIEEVVTSILTVTNEDNSQQVELMLEKAMHAYRNAKEAQFEHSRTKGNGSRSSYEKRLNLKLSQATFQGDYEATVACIAMFVDQPTSYVRQFVTDRCKAEYTI